LLVGGAAGPSSTTDEANELGGRLTGTLPTGSPKISPSLVNLPSSALVTNGDGVAETDPGAEGNPVLLADASRSILEVYMAGTAFDGAGEGGRE
jgi:hypothetical protein